MLFTPTRTDHLGNTYLQYYPPQNVFHPGVDFNYGSSPNADLGQDVLSPTWGIVEYVSPPGTNGGLGNYLVICYPHHGVWTRDLHLETVLVSVGQKVAPGQVVAKLGDTGTTSAHLHFEVLNQSGRNFIKNWWRPYGRYPSGLSKQAVASMWLDPLAWIRNSEQPAPGPNLNARLEEMRQELAAASGPRKLFLQRLLDRLRALVTSTP